MSLESWSAKPALVLHTMPKTHRKLGDMRGHSRRMKATSKNFFSISEISFIMAFELSSWPIFDCVIFPNVETSTEKITQCSR